MKERERERGRERGWILFVARQPASLTSYFYHTYATFTLPVCSRRYLSIPDLPYLLTYITSYALPSSYSRRLCLHHCYIGDIQYTTLTTPTTIRVTERMNKKRQGTTDSRHHTTSYDANGKTGTIRSIPDDTRPTNRHDTTRYPTYPTIIPTIRYLSIPTSKSVPPISKWSR